MMRSPLTVTVIGLSHEGRGIAEHEQKKIFIKGALPGETLTIHRIKEHKKFAEAHVLDVLIPSSKRVSPPCPHVRECGGCLLQHLSSQAQLEHKQQVLEEQLNHFGRTRAKSWLPPLTGPLWHYRHKARLGVKYLINQKKIMIGFRDINSHRINDSHTCSILPKQISDHLPAFASMIQALSIAEAIPQLELAVGDQQTAVIIRHLKPLTACDIKQLTEFGQAMQFEIYSQPQKDTESIQAIWPNDAKALLTYSLPDYQLSYTFHPTDFTQINPIMNQQMVKQALSLLKVDDKDDVLDLFCGLGNFSLPLARYANTVVGVEGDVNMVHRARNNSQLNHLTNTQFFTSDLNQWDPMQPWVKPYTKLVLDPPRLGAETIVRHIRYFSYPEILYVSCNPATLARDAGILIEQGYTCDVAGILDMFPHTGHIESMARFYHQVK